MEHLKIGELVEFSLEKRIRKKLCSSEKMVAGLLCYEPGQSTPVHHHPKQDEIFYVVEGSGQMIVDNEKVSLHPTSLIFLPAQASHGITAATDSRLVILFIKAPSSTASV